MRAFNFVAFLHVLEDPPDTALVVRGEDYAVSTMCVAAEDELTARRAMLDALYRVGYQVDEIELTQHTDVFDGSVWVFDGWEASADLEVKEVEHDT